MLQRRTYNFTFSPSAATAPYMLDIQKSLLFIYFDFVQKQGMLERFLIMEFPYWPFTIQPFWLYWNILEYIEAMKYIYIYRCIQIVLFPKN